MEEGSKTEELENVEIKVPCEVFSRIVGYIRPTSAWNDGKQQEFADRKMFRVPERDAR